VPIPRLDQRNCPHCRARTDAGDALCRACGHLLRPARQGSITRRYPVLPGLRAPGVAQPEITEERRRGPRHPVLLPVVYASDDLTFDAIARDLSLQGMFLETELLEPVGTTCTLTVLADGAPAITISAVVSRVVDAKRPSGLGLRVTSMGPEAEAWLTHVIERLEAIEVSAKSGQETGEE
ncbi:MAG: PilZ domain-containing protein, partial [Deltaproteobacteria bacterium]